MPNPCFIHILSLKLCSQSYGSIVINALMVGVVGFVNLLGFNNGSCFSGLTADALISTGLSKLGYTYVNIGTLPFSFSLCNFQFSQKMMTYFISCYI